MSAVLTVFVTPDDIAQCTRGDVCLCPFALAIRRAILDGTGNRMVGVFVRSTKITIHHRSGRDDYSRQKIQPSEHLQDWIRAFDRGEKVKPICFQIPRP